MHLNVVISCIENHRCLISATPYLVFKTWNTVELGKYVLIAAVLLFLCKYYEDLKSRVKKCLMKVNLCEHCCAWLQHYVKGGKAVCVYIKLNKGASG